MKVTVEVNMDNDAFGEDLEDALWELSNILRRVPDKVRDQYGRPEALCDAPESADKLRDVNGNTVGYVRLER